MRRFYLKRLDKPFDHIEPKKHLIVSRFSARLTTHLLNDLAISSSCGTVGLPMAAGDMTERGEEQAYTM